MEMIMSLDPVIVNWRRKLSDTEAYFVEIKTTKALYERAAVVDESDGVYTVEFPARKQASGKSLWVIRREIVPKKEVIWMRGYED